MIRVINGVILVGDLFEITYERLGVVMAQVGVLIALFIFVAVTSWHRGWRRGAYCMHRLYSQRDERLFELLEVECVAQKAEATTDD